MKYIWINDISHIIKKQYKIILLYLLIPLSYFIFNIAIYHEINNTLLYNSLGLKCNLESLIWLDIIIFFFYLSIFCYIALILFTKDFKNNLCNIFLRMKPTNWIIKKTVSISIISILMLLLIYITILSITLIFKGTLFGFDITLFIKNVLLIMIIENTSLIIYFIYKKIKYLLPILALIIFINIFNIPTIIVDMNIYILIISFIASYIVLLLLNKFLYKDLFEGE